MDTIGLRDQEEVGGMGVVVAFHKRCARSSCVLKKSSEVGRDLNSLAKSNRSVNFSEHSASLSRMEAALGEANISCRTDNARTLISEKSQREEGGTFLFVTTESNDFTEPLARESNKSRDTQYSG